MFLYVTEREKGLHYCHHLLVTAPSPVLSLSNYKGKSSGDRLFFFLFTGGVEVDLHTSGRNQHVLGQDPDQGLLQGQPEDGVTAGIASGGIAGRGHGHMTGGHRTLEIDRADTEINPGLAVMTEIALRLPGDDLAWTEIDPDRGHVGTEGQDHGAGTDPDLVLKARVLDPDLPLDRDPNQGRGQSQKPLLQSLGAKKGGFGLLTSWTWVIHLVISSRTKPFRGGPTFMILLYFTRSPQQPQADWFLFYTRPCLQPRNDLGFSLVLRQATVDGSKRQGHINSLRIIFQFCSLPGSRQQL